MSLIKWHPKALAIYVLACEEDIFIARLKNLAVIRLPKLHSDNFKGLELIRPLYLVKEASINAWRNSNELTFINCACKFTEECAIEDENKSKREEMKKLIKQLRSMNRDIDYNIFKSLDNINLNCVLGVKKDGIYKSFMEDYDKIE